MKIFFKILFLLCVIPTLVFFVDLVTRGWSEIPNLGISIVKDALKPNYSDDFFPEETTSKVTTPEVTTPEVNTPEVNTPEVNTPEVNTPEVNTPEVNIPEDVVSTVTGLAYTVNRDRKTCTITGIGTCTDNDLVIGTHIDGYEITAIGNQAFKNCSNLTSVTIGDSVTTIGYNAFYNCSNLTSVTIGDSVITIDFSAFSGCSNLTSVTIPDSVITIGEWAFDFCRGLTSVTIGNSVTTISDAAFAYCTGLTSVTIPASVTTIGAGVFENCSNLTSILVDENNAAYQSINGNLYSKDSTVLVAYAAGKTDRSFVIPDSVTTIGVAAFSGCRSLLTNVTIPASVTTIGDEAFYACFGIKSVTIPASVTTIGERVFRFTSLTSIVVDENNAAYQSINGNLYSKDGTVLVAYARYKKDTSFVIPNSVTTIGNDAFFSCDNLTSVTIPDSVTSIGDEAFAYSDKLTSITFEGTVAQWNILGKGSSWNYSTGEYTVYCTNGTIAKAGTVTYY